MSTERATRLRDLFDAALETEPTEREQRLHLLCPDDEQLRQEVHDLLRYASPDKSAALAQPIATMVRDMTGAKNDAAMGQLIGPWRVLAEIGRGGMGTVYKVERRDADYQQIAALKLIRGFPTAESVARFKRERRLLATLDHPGIARLIDGGTTTEGQPYLVMALIDGVALSTWRKRENPSPQRCARVMQKLCDAVQYAHQHLIVHRDLKPGNVLVGADDQPTLLDFGIAKLLADSDDSAATAAQIMTPAYASPEQRAGKPATTVTDIYGLGLIFFELLTGKSYQGETYNGEQMTKVLPKGDLANIVRMALREEPARRYQSAAAMADDIARFFAGHALHAVPDRWPYRARKFFWRHRIGALFTIVLALLISGFALRLRTERDHALSAQRTATREAATSAQVTSFLQNLFKQADPETAQGREFTAREMLANGAQELTEKSIPDPRVRARLNATVGEIYNSIGEPKRGSENLREALWLMRADSKTDPRLLANCLHEYARALTDNGEFAAAQSAALEALNLRENLPDVSPAQIASTLNVLGVSLQSQAHYTQAAAAYQRGLGILQSHGDLYPEELASTLHNLGWLADQQGDRQQAKQLLERALLIKRKLFGEDHPKVLNSKQVLAQVLVRMGDLAAALLMQTDLLERRRRVNGENSLATSRAYNEVASTLQDLGHYQRALPYYEKSQKSLLQVEPGDSVELAVKINNLASLLEDRGDLTAAEKGYRSALAMRLKFFAADHPAVARAQHNLARTKLSQGDLAEATSMANAAATTRHAKLPNSHPERFDSDLLLARIDIARDQLALADTKLQGLEPFALSKQADYLRAARWYAASAELAGARGDLVNAIAASKSQLAQLQTKLADDHPKVALAKLALARLLGLRGETAQSHALAREAQTPIQAELAIRAAARMELRRLLQ
jgi:eukaryotic-like serine/threonine-protein kinase